MLRVRSLRYALILLPVLAGCSGEGLSSEESDENSGGSISGSSSIDGFEYDEAVGTSESALTPTDTACSIGPNEKEANDTQAAANAFAADKEGVCGALTVTTAKKVDTDMFMFPVDANATSLRIGASWTGKSNPTAAELAFRFKAFDKAGKAVVGSDGKTTEFAFNQLSSVKLSSLLGGKVFVYATGTLADATYKITRTVTVGSATPSTSDLCSGATAEKEDNGTPAKANAAAAVACGVVASTSDVDEWVVTIPASATKWSASWKVSKAGISVTPTADWAKRTLRFKVTSSAASNQYRIEPEFN